MSTSSIHSGAAGCQICLSKNQQILAKDEVIRAKDAVIAAKDDAIAQKDSALKAERELREQLQKQLKLASAGVAKKSSIVNLKSASSQAQEEKDALTIYIRNVTENVTYDMLHEAFSAFGTIRTLNVVHNKACAFVEFASPEAHQKALAATSVRVGNGQDNVLTEKRVRKPQTTFTRRPSMNNLKSFSSTNNLNSAYAPHSVSAATASSNTATLNSNNGHKVVTTGSEGHDHGHGKDGWTKKEDEGCDLTAAC
ncbi:hypothetical protein BGZ93_010129 [Podila epicladia]|nr:hypothetical protein BGZ92_007637 [Podila epicladia]KAG0088914.1 hypothetical protein BGZ93_010129 [Podila epicladia]